MNTLDSAQQAATLEREANADFVPSGDDRPVTPPATIRHRARNFFFQIFDRAFRGESRPPSILRNNTNLPVFLALALGLSLVCNLALRESSAHASRPLGSAATLREAQEQVAKNPEEPASHSRLGELYMQQRNFKRAMFHFREAGRLSDLYGE